MTNKQANSLVKGSLVIANKSEPCYDSSYTKGKVYKVKSIERYGSGHVTICTMLDNQGSTTNGWGCNNFELAPIFEKDSK